MCASLFPYFISLLREAIPSYVWIYERMMFHIARVRTCDANVRSNTEPSCGAKAKQYKFRIRGRGHTRLRGSVTVQTIPGDQTRAGISRALIGPFGGKEKADWPARHRAKGSCTPRSGTEEKPDANKVGKKKEECKKSFCAFTFSLPPFFRRHFFVPRKQH